MAEEKNIIDFEDLFEPERNKRIENYVNPERRNNYIRSLLVYFIVMFVIASLLYAFLFSMPAFRKTYTEQESLIEALSYDVYGFVLLSEETTYGSDYVEMIGQYEGYYVYVNQFNSQTSILYEDDIFNPLIFDDIFNQSITKWDQGNLIHFYQGDSQIFTFNISFEISEEFIIESYTNLSSLGLNVLNFSIYMILLPWIILLLKSDMVYDFKKFKVLGTQIITILVMGYLLVILGNLFANVFASFLSDLFKIEIQEAANQITIIKALNAPGMPLMLISAIILGPIVEELIFRKAIFGLFKNVNVALFVSSISFGVIHLIGETSVLEAILNGLSYFVMGFVFGYIYIKNDKNIWAPIFVHILTNLIAIIAILFFPF
jgi:uncharacterized protein